MRQSILFFLLATSMVWAEPSVYSNSGSYASSKKNYEEITSLKGEVSQLRQEIEGLRSIVEGLSQSIAEIRQKEMSNGSTSSISQQQIEALEARLKRLEGKRDNTRISTTKASKKKKIAKASNPLESASSSALYSRGVRLVKKKKYSMAKQRFDILKKRGYKKASTYFYLGEIAYRTKHYSDAISYYKISAEANENANYMDTLLLHTGIALEKKGDKVQAKRFFQAIVDGYPETGSAKVAKKHL